IAWPSTGLPDRRALSDLLANARRHVGVDRLIGPLIECRKKIGYFKSDYCSGQGYPARLERERAGEVCRDGLMAAREARGARRGDGWRLNATTVSRSRQ